MRAEAEPSDEDLAGFRRPPRIPSPRLLAPVLVALALVVAVVVAVREPPGREPRGIAARGAPVEPLFGGSLEPGRRYGTRFLVPAITFSVGDDRWFVTDDRRPNLLVLERREGMRVPGGERPPRSFLVFEHPSVVFDPDRRGLRRSVVPAPADIGRWLRRHPDLRAGTPRPARLAGARGERFDLAVSFKRPRHPDAICRLRGLVCTSLWPGAAFRRGTRIRALVLDLAAGPLLIRIQAPGEAELRELLPRAQAVLDSVRFVTRP